MKKKYHKLRGEPLAEQAFDFGLYLHTLLKSIVDAHEKYTGIQIMNSEGVERVIEMDLLEISIALGKYDPELKPYLMYDGHLNGY